MHYGWEHNLSLKSILPFIYLLPNTYTTFKVYGWPNWIVSFPDYGLPLLYQIIVLTFNVLTLLYELDYLTNFWRNSAKYLSTIFLHYVTSTMLLFALLCSQLWKYCFWLVGSVMSSKHTLSSGYGKCPKILHIIYWTTLLMRNQTEALI